MLAKQIVGKRLEEKIIVQREERIVVRSNVLPGRELGGIYLGVF
jgi:hypothetical protein